MGTPEKKGDSAVRHPSFFGMTETPFDPVLMFKDLGLDGTVPNAATVWLFREHLVKAKAIGRLFARLNAELTKRATSQG